MFHMYKLIIKLILQRKFMLIIYFPEVIEIQYGSLLSVVLPDCKFLRDIGLLLYC